MLTIERSEVILASLPFRRSFRHAAASRTESGGVFVRLRGGGHVGHGEALPRDYVTGESATTAAGRLREELLPLLQGARFDTFEDTLRWIESRLVTLPRNAHAAFCALELALLDLAGRAFACCAGEAVGPLLANEARYDAVVSGGGAGLAEEAKATCRQAREFGIGGVKVKVGGTREEDATLLRIARDELGPAIRLRVDANGALGRDEALARIEAWRDFALDAFEQPVAGDADTAIGDLVWLAARSAVPIVADESLVARDDARRLADAARRADVASRLWFNLRVSKCGGLVNTRRLHAMAREAGIACMLGAQVGESAILTAAGRQAATRLPDLKCLEGSYGKFLLESDLASEDMTFGKEGRAPALNGVGLGMTIAPGRLDNFAARSADGTGAGGSPR